MSIAFEDLRSDLACVSFTADPTDEDVRAFVDFLEKKLQPKQTHATIIDMSHISSTTSAMRHAVADYVRKNYDDLKRHRAGTAFVVRSVLARGIVTAIMWMQRPPYPFILVPTRQAAVAWCEEQLARHPG